MRQKFVIAAIVSTILLLALVLYSKFWLGGFLITGPIILLGLRDMYQTNHSILRLYPVLGHFRYILESVRSEIQQYFVESNTDETPISREFRSLVYQRSKGDRDTRPFGTIFDVNRSGYEWLNHSIQPKHLSDTDPRIKMGGPDCTQPYMASPLNISAMSYG